MKKNILKKIQFSNLAYISLTLNSIQNMTGDSYYIVDSIMAEK